MTTSTEDTLPTTGPTGGPQPCAARPHANLVHLDGPCRCFVGGPAPEHGPTPSVDPLGLLRQRSA